MRLAVKFKRGEKFGEKNKLQREQKYPQRSQPSQRFGKLTPNPSIWLNTLATELPLFCNGFIGYKWVRSSTSNISGVFKNDASSTYLQIRIK